MGEYFASICEGTQSEVVVVKIAVVVVVIIHLVAGYGYPSFWGEFSVII